MTPYNYPWLESPHISVIGGFLHLHDFVFLLLFVVLSSHLSLSCAWLVLLNVLNVSYRNSVFS